VTAHTYSAADISEEQEDTPVPVVGEQNKSHLMTGKEPRGLNVLFYPSDKIDTSTADYTADLRWRHHRQQITDTTKKALKQHCIDPLYGNKTSQKNENLKIKFKEFLLAEIDETEK
jgi:hypothetical protein